MSPGGAQWQDVLTVSRKATLDSAI